ncbi:hypothetical protein VB774_01165 [Pseudanabaena galeata UHCC 0370]|uniref:Uncharacterized protein n=1 Tax=Pseudanabaena galeata UHCC 0370 TaxID=3110310 RepID=A0ABU5TDL1_9CYAN|nr:hypothetical protein [Pseudanabaena galeata]MEA5476217.1 hypothetical protein [Pseudanabaena galeata UHCC 0370]
MLDLLLSTTINTTQIQLVAQSQATIVYLPISTKQSTTPKCVTYVAKNSTGRTVRNVKVNRRNSQGKIYQERLTSSLAAGKTTSFDQCQSDGSFVNVEARQ